MKIQIVAARLNGTNFGHTYMSTQHALVRVSAFNSVLLPLIFSTLSLATPIKQAWAGTYANAMQSAAQWLETQQDISDGSWHGESSDITFLQTAEALRALHQTNRRQSSYYAAQTWVENHAATNLDASSRRLSVLRVTQSSTAADTAALLNAGYSPASGQLGWGLAKRYRPSPLDTAMALDALRASGASFSDSGAIAYLKATQNTGQGDMGWSATAFGASDAYTTARVIQSLSAYQTVDATLTTPLSNACNMLKAKVSTASPPHVRAAAAVAYLKMNPGSADATILLNSLTGLQNTNGGFAAGVWTTALIVQAFAAAEGPDSTSSLTRVDITDAALRDAINAALGRGALDGLNRGELARLVSLDISGRAISNLNGLQFATNLATLNASNNQITDISPISGLTNLTSKQLSGNPCCDTSPDPFSFGAAVLNSKTNTWIESTLVSPVGFNIGEPVSIVGGQYSINNAAYTASPGEILPGQTIRVRVLSSAAYETSTEVLVDIGGQQASFQTTTMFNPAKLMPILMLLLD